MSSQLLNVELYQNKPEGVYFDIMTGWLHIIPLIKLHGYLTTNTWT